MQRSAVRLATTPYQGTTTSTLLLATSTSRRNPTANNHCRRSFIPYASKPIGARKKSYSERRLLGYVNVPANPFGKNNQQKIKRNFKIAFFHQLFLSNAKRFFFLPKTNRYSAEQMFEIVQHVELYPQFVPWCTRASVTQRNTTSARAMMQIGFAPISERYTSHLTFRRPELVRSECVDGRLFNHLVTQWRFEPGLLDNESTCMLDFYVSRIRETPPPGPPSPRPKPGGEGVCANRETFDNAPRRAPSPSNSQRRRSSNYCLDSNFSFDCRCIIKHRHNIFVQINCRIRKK